MNDIEKQKIKELLKTRKELINQLLFKRDYNEVIQILSLPEWENNKFKKLLTSNIWQSNAQDIKTILSMQEWDDPRFSNLSLLPPQSAKNQSASAGATFAAKGTVGLSAVLPYQRFTLTKPAAVRA